MVLILALLQGSDLAAQSQPAKVPDVELVKIATHSYRIRGEDRAMTLWRQNIPLPSDSEVLSFFIRHPGQTSFPNTAFLLVVSGPGDLSKGRVVWAAYIFNNKQSVPRQTWTADVGGLASAGSIHVVLVRSVAQHVEFRVYSASEEQNRGSFPVTFDPVTFDQWPRADGPTSVLDKALAGRDISGISEVHIAANGGTLTIQGIRDLAGSPPVVFNFDVATNSWSQVDPSVAGK